MQNNADLKDKIEDILEQRRKEKLKVDFFQGQCDYLQSSVFSLEDIIREREQIEILGIIFNS